MNSVFLSQIHKDFMEGYQIPTALFVVFSIVSLRNTISMTPRSSQWSHCNSIPEHQITANDDGRQGRGLLERCHCDGKVVRMS